VALRRRGVHNKRLVWLPWARVGTAVAEATGDETGMVNGQSMSPAAGFVMLSPERKTMMAFRDQRSLGLT
jgi:hypothetical protein